MPPRLTMVYWKGEQFWLGKLLEHPEIMTPGETLEVVRSPRRSGAPSLQLTADPVARISGATGDLGPSY